MRLYFLGFSSIKDVKDLLYDQEIFLLNHPSEIDDATLKKFKRGIVFLNATKSSTIGIQSTKELMENLDRFTGIHFVIISDHTYKGLVSLNTKILYTSTGDAETPILGLAQNIKENLSKFIGKTTEARKLRRNILYHSFHDGNILILGETGTGKTLLAEIIHKISPRKEGKMVSLNCATMPDSLIESELFGHARGAFTSADSKKRGMIENANHGHMFLDEIAELSPRVQGKLLYIVEKGAYNVIGDPTPRKVDVKFISATNREPNRIRRDLFFRLSENVLEIPPLRQRKNDIPLLVNHFFESKRLKVSFEDLTNREREMLLEYNYPGNVRELENILERYIVTGSIELLLSESKFFTVNIDNVSNEIEGPILEHISSLVDSIVQSNSLPKLSIFKSHVIEELEKQYVEKVLRIFKWSKQQASKELGITHRYLNKLITKYAIDRRMKERKGEKEKKK